MNFIKRSLASILRNRVKTILLFLIIFILGNVMAGAVSIKEASKNVEEQVKMKLGAVAGIQIDHEEMEKHMVEEKTDDGQIIHKGPDLEELTDDTIRTIANSKYVKAFDFVSRGQYFSRDLKEWIHERNKNNDFQMGPEKGLATINVIGTEYNNILKIEQGTQFLESGRVFTKEEIENGNNVTVINKKFADVNNLKVDDNLILNLISYDFEKMYSPDAKRDDSGRPKAIILGEKEIALKIIGIYSDKEKPKTENNPRRYNPNNDPFRLQMDANSIYLSNKTNSIMQEEIMKIYNESKGLKEDTKHKIYKESIFMLKDPNDVEKFKAESEPLLPNFRIIRATTDEYKKIAGPIEKSTTMANYILIVSVVASILIVSLVTMLFLRDRKHEFGIYLSLGEKRTKVISQILVELLIISVIAVTLSVFTGNIIAGSLSSSIIKEDSQTDMNRVYYHSSVESYKGEDISQEDILNTYKVELTNGYIIAFVIISLGTILIAAIIPMLYIMRLNPKKIMM